MLRLVAFVVVFIAAVALADDLIIKPKTTSSGAKAIALLFAPGFGIGPGAYKPLLSTLQSLVEQDGTKALWVGCPQMNGNITTVGLEGALKKLAAKMTDAGLPADHGTLYSGHSVGGALLPYIVRKPDNMAEGFNSPEGMMLLASFLVREFRTEAVADKGPGQYEFPTSVLTIGGELDGLSRVTRIAEAFHTQITMNTNPDGAKKRLPVTVVEGVTHMQFASGEIPSNVMKKDLIPEVSYDEAHSLIASDMMSFISGIYDDNWDTLLQRVEETNTFVSPIVDTLLLEGYHQFKPPCYCEETDEYGGLEYGTCPQMPGCTASSPWTQTGQEIIAQGQSDDIGKGLRIAAADSQHIVTEENPSCHLPHVHAGSQGGKTTPNSVPSANPGNGESDPLCSSPDGCTLTVNTITQLMYESGSEFDWWRINTGNDNVDSGYWPISAKEMKAKMKSRQSLWQAANNTKAVSGELSFDDLDSPEQGLCASINAASIEWGNNAAAAKTRDRYEKYGQKMVADPSKGDKKVCVAGPCWIWADLEYQGERKQQEEIDIVAPTFAFENKNPYPCGEKTPDKQHVLPCTAGMHYCKLLSPARVVEWMYVDGLRLHYSLASQNQKKGVAAGAASYFLKKDEPKCCETCPDGTDKYYSVPKMHQKNCGESCIAPEDVKKYSMLEPGLTKAETNTPCIDLGYTDYDHTETHGKHTPLAVTVDFYVKQD